MWRRKLQCAVLASLLCAVHCINVLADVEEKGIQETKVNFVDLFQEERIDELRTLTGMERVRTIDSLVASVADEEVFSAVELLSPRQLGYVESRLLTCLLFRACQLERFEALEVFYDEVDVDLEDRFFFRLGWMLAELDLEAGLRAVAWGDENGMIDSFLEGFVYSLKEYNSSAIVTHFGYLSNSETACEVMEDCLSDLARSDPAASMALQERFKDSIDLIAIARSVVAGLANSDPEAALEMALRCENPYQKNAYFSTLVQTMAGKDGKAAMEMVNRILEVEVENPTNLEASLVKSVVDGWIGANPLECLRWMGDSNNRALRNSMVNSIDVWRIDAERLESVVSELSASGSLLGSSALKEKLFQGWSDRSPEAFAKWAQGEKDLNWYKYMKVGGWNQLALSNSDLARKIVFEMPRGMKQLEAIGAVARSWSQSDMSGFLGWVDKFESEDAMESALYTFVDRRQIGSNIEEELAFAGSLPDGRVRSCYEQKLAQGIWSENLDTAVALAVGIQDESVRSTTLSRLATNLARSDVQEALRIGKENPALARTDFLVNVISNIADLDAEEAYQHLGSIAGSEKTTTVVRKVYRKLFDQDEEYALSLIESEPSQVNKDAGWAAVSEQVGSVRPEEGLEYALRVKDSQLRIESLKNSFGTLVRAYPDRATDWLESADIPDQEFEELLELTKMNTDEEEIFVLESFSVRHGFNSEETKYELW